MPDNEIDIDSKRPASASLDDVLATSSAPENRGASAGLLADDYRVRIPNFEGPLDLLLHLIRKDQLNIYDIPIAQICKTYLEHIELMRQPDVNIAGEFMVMAATLTHMKSQILLPVEGGEASGEEDPRLPLVAQLLEYEKFKKMAEQLDEMPWLHRDIFPRPLGSGQEMIPVESLLDAPLEPVDTFQLLLCLKSALNRTERPPLQISTDPTSIKEKVTAMTVILEQTEIMEFKRLLPDVCRARDIIVAFLAVLELAKLRFIEIVQHETFGPIQVRAVRPLRELNAALLDQY